jgi:hypothetical protein
LACRVDCNPGSLCKTKAGWRGTLTCAAARLWIDREPGFFSSAPAPLEVGTEALEINAWFAKNPTFDYSMNLTFTSTAMHARRNRPAQLKYVINQPQRGVMAFIMRLRLTGQIALPDAIL